MKKRIKKIPAFLQKIKAQEMQGILKYERKIVNWREKAKHRSQENSKYRRQIKKLQESRAKWKEKYKSLQASNKALAVRIKQQEVSVIESHGTAKGHQYDLGIVSMSMALRQGCNCSLRSCVSILEMLCIVLQLELKIPSHSSIQNWEKKLGYYRLGVQEEQDREWMLIIDESISIGSEKLLVLLGVDLGQYEFGSALNFGDIQVLNIQVRPSWNGEEIGQRIEALLLRNYKLSYGVSDGGTNIVKALKDKGIPRVADCSHYIGNLLKRQYSKSAEFMVFSQRCGLFKRQMVNGKDAYLMPPKQRTKGRFLNLAPLSEWAVKMLDLLANPSADLSVEQCAKLEWLKDYEDLVRSIDKQCQVMKELSKLLKTEGLNERTKEQCIQIAKSNKLPAVFERGIILYVEDFLLEIQGQDSLICSSDILESVFGKFKKMKQNGATKEITDACLTIANFGQNADKSLIKNALEEIKIVDLQQWKKKNLKESIHSKRKKLFKSVA